MTTIDKKNPGKSIQPNKQKILQVAQEYRKEVNDTIKLDIESYYKILTILSSIIPIFSIGILKFLDIKLNIELLKYSWTCFFLALVLGMLSIYVNLVGSQNRRANIYSYYLENDENAFIKADKIGNLAANISIASFVFFIIGVFLLLIFLWIKL